MCQKKVVLLRKYPYIILTLNLSGLSHALYDMKDIREYNNGLSPLAWIQNYVSSQAIRLMNEQPMSLLATMMLKVNW